MPSISVEQRAKTDAIMLKINALVEDNKPHYDRIDPNRPLWCLARKAGGEIYSAICVVLAGTDRPVILPVHCSAFTPDPGSIREASQVSSDVAQILIDGMFSAALIQILTGPAGDTVAAVAVLSYFTEYGLQTTYYAVGLRNSVLTVEYIGDNAIHASQAASGYFHKK